MIDVDVLSTAAGLREFDAATVAAYCQAEENDVVLILTEHQDLFVKKIPRHGPEPAIPRWRVANVEGLRQRISFSHPDSHRDSHPETTTSSRSARSPRSAGRRVAPGNAGGELDRTELDQTAEPGMMLAEQSLLACADEADLVQRHHLASRAMNYLSECISVAQGNNISSLPARLRFDLALAALTLSETTSQSIPRDLLISAYDDATGYAETRLPDREAQLLRRFRELAAYQSAGHCVEPDPA